MWFDGGEKRLQDKSDRLFARIRAFERLSKSVKEMPASLVIDHYDNLTAFEHVKILLARFENREK